MTVISIIRHAAWLTFVGAGFFVLGQEGSAAAQDVADITRSLPTAKPQALDQGALAAAAAAPSPSSATPTGSAGSGWTLRSAGNSRLSVAERRDRLIILHEGATIGEFVFDDARIRRPFFANLRAPGGIPVTRTWPPVEGVDATDHADMHPGVWLAFGDINGSDFWRNKARIEHVRFTQPPLVRDGRLVFATECRLRTADGQTLCALTNRFTLAAQTNAWLLVWEATFRSDENEFTFGDQEEMGFGARVATAITERNGGVITSSTGLKSAKDTWGRPSAWCNYSGTVDGSPVGITLLTDPKNFRPSWWHNRDYGLFVANPFGRAAMRQGDTSAVTVKRGEDFQVRFGALIYKGPDLAPASAGLEFSTP